MSGDNGFSILQRIIENDAAGLSQASAEAVLRLHFSESDHIRISELAEKSNFGKLSEKEAQEYEGYIQASDVLSFWKSKARQLLKHQAVQA
jgi:hypothetical protein